MFKAFIAYLFGRFQQKQKDKKPEPVYDHAPGVDEEASKPFIESNANWR